MPWPDFSELSFGYGFLREFERRYTPGGRFPVAPDFITQSAEATAGYDAEVLSGTTPVFFQFKRSFVLTTRNATEIQLGHFTDPKLYRMHLRKKDEYRQHRALQDLESVGHNVFYVTSQIENPADLTRSYLADTVISEAAAIFSPNELQLPNLHESHHVCFRAEDDFAYLYSKEGSRRERKFPRWELVSEALNSDRQSPEENRKALSEFVEQLAGSRRDAAAIANRFKDDVARASVMAFLLLDLQMTFFGAPAVGSSPAKQG